MLRLRAINTLASLGPLPGLAVLHRSQRAADWKEIMSRKRSEDRPDIESIRERCDAATAGPWAAADAREEICRRAAFNPWYTCQVVVPLRGKPQYKGHNQSETIARVQMTDELSAVGCSQFIATARTDVPELLDYIERLERKCAAADKFVAIIRNYFPEVAKRLRQEITTLASVANRKSKTDRRS